ncbi:titin [Caerostris extrusa]|uniref:Titin n=1 Tax=Caerostris extrusa TaxID=172846 RepID=A0AAV4USS5_CAEEX|nr:titin [Caerostris extrusa]
MWLTLKLTIVIQLYFVPSFVSSDSGEPKIKPFQFSNDLDLGMREAVHCIVTHGNPPFEFSWYKDGHQLIDRPGTSIRKIDDYDSKLVISKLDADSNGNYTCRVTNSVGIDQKSTLLSVKDSGEPKIKSFHFNRDLKIGMRESVNCAVVDGDPPFEIVWFKDGRPLVDGQGISIRKSDDYDSKLVISKVNADSNGNYTCKVSNSKGFDEKSAILSVKGFGEPKIKSFHFSNELELGMRESVHCTVLYGDTPFELSWFKDGQLLKDGQGISIRKMDEYHSNLVISNIDADSNGNYTCKVTNIKGSDAKSAILSVKDSERPKIKTFHFSNVLELGMRESVQCTVMSGDSPFEFSWLKRWTSSCRFTRCFYTQDRQLHVYLDDFQETVVDEEDGVITEHFGIAATRCAIYVGFPCAKAEIIPVFKRYRIRNERSCELRCHLRRSTFRILMVQRRQPLIDSRDISYRKTDDSCRI